MTSAIDEMEPVSGTSRSRAQQLKTLAWQVPLFILGWTAVGVAFAAQHYLKSADLGEPVAWHLALGGALADWYVFAILSIPTCWLAGKFPLTGTHWRLKIALHSAACALFSLLWILLRVGLANWLIPHQPGGKPVGDLLRFALVATFFFNLLVYWVIVTAVHALAYYRSLRERERRVLELEHRLTTARLHALQMELNPHFLFNALNGISTLMYRDVDIADSMLLKLAALLRHALDRSDRQKVALGEELEFLGKYLDLEQMRFGSRLSVERDIEPAALDASVPNLLLQPLVENAIKHGFEPQARPGTIRIVARIIGDRLRLEVEDNGKGLPVGQPVREGVGTANSKARLAQLYGRNASLNLERGREGGVRAVVEIPLTFVR